MVENDKYFRINLESSRGLISIHEKKNLAPGEYHSVDKNDTNDYQILVEIEKEVGKAFYSLNVLPESYKTYEFQDITYQIINDYEVDGFEYDSERKVVFYGWIYGIYAIKNGNNYYDVVTGEEIPCEIISSVLEIETVDNYSEMIEDLELIKKHKNIYTTTTKERFSKLSQGVMNQKKASQLYKQNYEAKKKAQDKKRIEKENCYQHIRDELKVASYLKREVVKQLIYEIRNN